MAHLIGPSTWFRIVLAPLLYVSDKSITWFSCSYLFFNHGKERNKLMSCVTIEMEIIRLNKDIKKEGATLHSKLPSMKKSLPYSKTIIAYS